MQVSYHSIRRKTPYSLVSHSLRWVTFVYVRSSSLPPPPFRFYISTRSLLFGAFLHKLCFAPRSTLPWLLLATLFFYLPSFRTPTVHLSRDLRAYPGYAPDAHRPSRFNISAEAPMGERCLAPQSLGSAAHSPPAALPPPAQPVAAPSWPASKST